MLGAPKERVALVCEHFGVPLSNYKDWSPGSALYIVKDILSGLSYLHERGIVHRALSRDNIIVVNKHIKIFNYGLYYMSGSGADVEFPIGHPKYYAPEVILSGPYVPSGPKVDIWSVGIILVELLFKPFWEGLPVRDIIRKILGLVKEKKIVKILSQETEQKKKFNLLSDPVIEFMETLLTVNPSKRPSAADSLENRVFKMGYEEHLKRNSGRGWCYNEPLCFSLDDKSLCELYYLWLLAGGDVFTEFKKEGLIRTKPPILGIPNLLMLEGTCFGHGKDEASLLDQRVVHLQLGNLITRFGELPNEARYPLLVVRCSYDKDHCESSSLPLIIRERDTEYQFRRITLFNTLLKGFPHTSRRLRGESKQDIPPFLRAETWACLLGINCDYQESYLLVDKETSIPTDRQIEVDIPRCHQYSELLSSSVGHLKFKRILKAWVVSHPEYVYWQGLDSLCAPFLYLNFNNEARAYACLSKFIEKYLYNFFLKDNSSVIREYLTKFKQLIVFHDPELGNHLDNIGFAPELFAIPWYLTMFSHVFPINKILHLWDSLFLEKPSYPLFVGLAILQQLRPTLLSSGFNECILLFSDLPEIDIERCVKDSSELNKNTPKSITHRQNAFKKQSSSPFVILSKINLKITGLELSDLQNEFCPRINAKDFITIYFDESSYLKIIAVDIREPHLYNEEHLQGSVNIPKSKLESSLQKKDKSPTSSHSELKPLYENIGKIIVVIDDDMQKCSELCRTLAHYGFPKVCFLHGGISILKSAKCLSQD